MTRIWSERIDWFFDVDMAVYHTTGISPKFPVVPDAFLSLGVERKKDGKSRRICTIAALKRPNVVRWLTLLQFSDLMLDVFRGFVALYFVDVVGSSPNQASLAFSIWLGFVLLGDFFLVPLLIRVKGLTYLKISVMLVLFLYPAFLAVSSLSIKYIILGCLGFLNAGWYSILRGRL